MLVHGLVLLHVVRRLDRTKRSGESWAHATVPASHIAGAVAPPYWDIHVRIPRARAYNALVRSSGRAHLSAVTLAVLLLGGIAAWGFLTHLRKPELTPELRGYALAEKLGCHGCHGPRGTGGVPNPRAGLTQTTGEIPAWDGGTAMMYVKDEDEIREWILDGRPWRLVLRDSLEARGSARADTASPFPEPGRVELRARGWKGTPPPLRMPAARQIGRAHV